MRRCLTLALTTAHYVPFTLTLLHLGLRTGEGAGLRARDIDLTKGLLRIRGILKRSKYGKDKDKLVWQPYPKTPSGERAIPFGKELAKVLAPLVASAQKSRATNGMPLVFRTPAGAPIDTSTFGKRQFRPAAFAALMKRMNDAERTAVLAAVPVEFRLLVELLFFDLLSMRAVLSARWDDYDSRRGRLRYRVQHDGTEAETRLPKDVQDRLARHKAAQESDHRPNKHDLIFPGRGHRSSQIGIERLTAVVSEAFSEAGIDFDVRVHRLRHTFASAYAFSAEERNVGEAITRLQHVLGHSTFSYTYARYVHLWQERKAKPADTMHLYGPIPSRVDSRTQRKKHTSGPDRQRRRASGA